MLRLSILRALIRESLLLEDRVQDLIDTDETGNLWSAREMGVTQIAGLTWLKAMIKKNLVGDMGEPLADVIPDIKAFFRPGTVERIKKLGGYTDIMQYRTPSDLRNTILSISAPGGEVSVDPNDADIVYDKKSSPYQVVMPRTVKGSCKYGADGWCTTRTDQGNLFLHYVGSGRGIILFYILLKGANPRSNPNARLAVSTIKGKPHFDASFGGLSVDGANRGLTRSKFDEILGVEAQPILDAIVAHAASIGNQHPAAKEVDRSVASLAAWKEATDSLKPEIYNDYISFAFKERAPDREILEAALNDPRTTTSSKYYIYESPNFDTAVLINVLEQTSEDSFNEINPSLTALSNKQNVTYEEMQRAIEAAKKLKGGDLYAARLYKNPAIPAEALIEKYREASTGSMNALGHIALNPNLPDDFIMQILGEALDPYTPTTLKAQKFVVDVARSRKGDQNYARIIWDTVNDPKSRKAFQYTRFYTDLARSIAMHSEDVSLLEEVAESALNGIIARASSVYDGDKNTILLEIIANGAAPDSLIKHIAKEKEGYNTRIVMHAEARLKDPAGYDVDAVDEAHKEEYPEEYDDEGDRRSYDDDY